MLKKALALLTATCITFGAMPALAQEDEAVSIHTMEEKQTEKIELSLEAAINMALENHPRINAADAAIKSSALALEVAKDTSKEYKDMEKLASKIPGVSMAVNISAGLEQAYLKHGYYTTAATVGEELATLGKEQTVASVSYEVTQMYYNVKLMEALIGIAQTGVSLADDNLKLMESQYEAGYVSLIEVKNAKNAVAAAEYSLEGYKRNLEIAKKSFKIALQIDSFEGDIVLTDEIEIPDLPSDVTDKIDGAMESRYDMTAVKKDYELKKNMFDITAMYMSDKTASYYSAYSEYLKSEYTYNNTLKLMKVGLESEYAAILSAFDEIKKCESDLEVKTTIYESRKTMYELGLITNLELTGAMADVDSGRVALENARVTYALALIKFGYNTTIGL